MAETFYISDEHYFHKNIIKYVKRPFLDVADMNATIVANINRKVSKNDRLISLGDVSLWKKKRDTNKLIELRSQINCVNYELITGNHDPKVEQDLVFDKLFKRLGDLYEIKYNKQLLILSHYAMRTWKKSHRGSWHLYGHSHGELHDDRSSYSFDAGVDCWNFTPLSWDEIAQEMSLREWKNPLEGKEKWH